MMLDTECARVSTGAMRGEIGVIWEMPRPVAVAPISTILSWYFAAGILPVYTSKNESIENARLSPTSL